MDQTVILVIDDNEGDRYFIKDCLSNSDKDIRVLEAATAHEGLAIIKNEAQIDCVFVDYMLPDSDGISLLKTVYDTNTDLGPYPFVMLTGYGNETVAIDAIRFGAQDCVMKEHISANMLAISIAKARHVFDLKLAHNEAKNVLVQSQKMEAIGQLTGGIAHDFNNLLTIIFGNTHLLNKMIDSDKIEVERLRKRVGIIQKTTERGADLVKRLMLFSRQRVLQPVTLKPCSLILEIKDLLFRTLGDLIEIKTVFADGIYLIDVDPGQLEHAIINLCVNARDAMVDGGELCIDVHNASLLAEKAADLGVDPGEYAVISISDTGSGMPEELLKKIFEPFFTTKGDEHGTGLGLSMVRGLVRDSGGGVEVESVQGQGTSFTLYFPRSKNELERISEDGLTDEAVDDEVAPATILLVEDEEDIRYLTSSLLRSNHYKVLEAADGNEGLKILQEFSGHIDLIFTDIAMPGDMNGVQMAARAQAIQSDIKLLFTTGFAAGALPDMHLTDDYPMLHKPYQAGELLSKMRTILSS